MVGLRLAAIFDRLEIPYLVGGAVASVIYGEVRSTLDIDIVADLSPDTVGPLVAALEEDFYSAETGETLYVCSPEDIIVQKLKWYRLGREVSDRQWRDVLGVLKLQGEVLDFAYLRHWAGREEVADLLIRAQTEAGLGTQ